MTRYRPTTPRTCHECEGVFDALIDNLKRGWGRFCSRRCWNVWRGHQPSRARKVVIRRLVAGEAIPSGKPRRYYTSDGYCVLRWKVDQGQYVEALEHRVVVGVAAEHVHHKNGDKSDNRPENLEPLTAKEHQVEHHPPTFDTDEAAALYRSGWSLPRLSRKYMVHHVSIMRTLKKRGVVMRPRPGRNHLVHAGALTIAGDADKKLTFTERKGR